MSKLNYNEIENKWRKYWQENNTNKTLDDFSGSKGKFYVLDMFPYPSGEGLHVGHPKGYIATDVYSRMKKMQGYNVLHPMGWDAFGLPAEQFAIKNKVNPNVATEKNVKRYKEQIEMLGINYDWDREINTTDPKYYKWTQWMWKQMYKDGLSFESFDPINWCPSCKTGLANEDLDGNACERCGTIVEKKKLRQWTIRITDYADRLLNDIEKLNWEPHIKESQRNWIGKSEGSEIDFEILNPNVFGFDLKTIYDEGDENYKNDRKRTVAIIKIKGTDKFLGFKKPDDSRVYLPGGGKEFGENCIENAIRETREEIGITGLVHISPIATFRNGEYYELFEIEQGYKAIPSELDQKGNTLVEFTKEEILKNDFAQVSYIFNNLENLIEKSFKEKKLKIFTTRADTLFGCTFMAISYTLAKEWIQNGWEVNDEIRNFITKLEKEEKERTLDFDMSKLEKEGVDTGIKAVNPANGESVPIYIANYILSDYGTGAIMAVPAHDERDFEFAKKYNLEIKEVVAIPAKEVLNGELKRRDATISIVEDNNKFLVLSTKENKFLFPQGGIEESDINITESAKREIKEESGYLDVSLIRQVIVTENYFDMGDRGIRHRLSYVNHFKLNSNEQVSQKKEEYLEEDFIINWFSKEEVLEKLNTRNHKEIFEFFIENKIYEDEGILVNSSDFSGMNSEEARVKITEKVGGKMVSKYKLKDWVFARQRYWGEPFPIVFDENRKSFAVADKELPVILPNVENYEPTGTGESPLANIKDWVEVYGFINEEGEFESIRNYIRFEDRMIEDILSGTKINTIRLDKKNFEKDCIVSFKDQSDTIFSFGKILEIESKKLKDLDFNDTRNGTTYNSKEEQIIDFKKYYGERIDENTEFHIISFELFKSEIKKFFRETNTMPQWAGSSWYYLRYIDPKNDNVFADKELEKNWSPVDFYVGGAEHATRHLIYARFWHKYLFDKGLVSYDEPFNKLQTVGLIMAEDGKKMSKRYGNVVNPDDVVKEFGADAMRTYEMFMGPFDKAISWNTNSMAGVSRFLERFYNLAEKINLEEEIIDSKEIEFIINQSIKKVGEDIEGFKFNTAISQLMICLNTFEEEIKKGNKISKNTFENFTKLISPFAPHITEEIYQDIFNNNSSIHISVWPDYDENKIILDEVEMSLQISGKFRGTFKIKADASEDEVKELVKELDVYKKYILEESQIKKIIIVPKRLINIVI